MNTVKKFKKPRKPMSVQQRIAATERLAKAREKRLRENPPQYKNICPEVLAKPDDHALSLKNVRQWIKTQKGLLGAARSAMRNNVKGAIAEYHSIQGYIRHCEWYLKNGDWIDNYHTGYIIECLFEYQTLSKDYSFSDDIERGYEYYKNNFQLVTYCTAVFPWLRCTCKGSIFPIN